mmetsp:Transcript_60883/g.54871  ORF Transcript_60883/g.54871 Transcript_60883/m.54871 type:complete len:236 (+) Transcript_60883:77-784(+)
METNSEAPPAYPSIGPGASEGGAEAAPPPAYDASAPSAAYNPNAVQPQQVVYQQPVQQGSAPVYNAGAPQVGQPVVYQQAQPVTQGTPQQPVVYQQPPTQGGQPQQQVIYVNAQGQPIQPQQPQQQVVYVNAQGQPIQPQTTQPVMMQQPVVTQRQQPQVVTQTTVIHNQVIDDDPSCLYIFAVFGLFIWLVGAIGMCVYQCGSGLGPKRTQGFRVLCICTVIGFIWNIAYVVGQ